MLIIGKAKINTENFIKVSVIIILPKNNIQKSTNNPKNIVISGVDNRDKFAIQSVILGKKHVDKRSA